MWIDYKVENLLTAEMWKSYLRVRASCKILPEGILEWSETANLD